MGSPDPYGPGGLIIRPLYSFRVAAGLALVVSLATACADDPAPAPQLGPRDGAELPPVQPERIAVGDTAPDFTLRSHGGGIVTLSDYHGKKDIILVFYRGHW